MKFLFSVLAILVSSCASHHHDPVEAPKSAMSEIHSDKLDAVKGTIKIEDMPDKYKITTDISGLKPQSKFGFHIHQNGVCEGPDYKTAGNHFNPHHMPHGKPGKETKHTGDLGNLVTDANGESKQVIEVLKKEGDQFDQFINKSVLIHAKVDDLKTQPSGNSGDRIACGLIKPI
jgi:Cu-Zn family superoxide dismutase